MSPLTGTTLLIRLARPDGTLRGKRKKNGAVDRRMEQEREVRLKEDKMESGDVVFKRETLVDKKE